MTRDQALALVIQAAEKWHEELGEYIIPNATETCGNDAEGYQRSYNELGEALELLTQPEEAGNA